MNRKKGFTLVELLAVLVILGIVATIISPMVMTYIDESKEQSFKLTLDNVTRASSLYFNDNDIKNYTVVDLTTNKIKLGGVKLTKGLAVGNRKKSKVYIYKDGYCGIKDGSNITIKKTSANGCSFDIDNNIEIVLGNTVAKDKKIVGYRIYGNTIDNSSLGDTNKTITLKLRGKNLFDYKKINHSNIELIDDGIKILNSYATVVQMNMNNILEPNKTYTIQRVYTGTMNASNGMINMYSPKFLLCRYGKGLITNTFTAPEDLANYTTLYIYGTANEIATMTNIQIEEGNVATTYEPYLEPKEYNITLKEPLRSFNNNKDYIDSNISQIVRQVGVSADGSLYALDEPIYEYIKLPTINNLDGTTIISASDGSINASAIEISISK